MKTVSCDLELKLTEAARKHGVVLPNASSCWMCDDLGRWYMHIGVHWKNNFDFTSLPAHTADELMDWLPIYITLLNHGRFYLMIEKESDPFYFTVIYHQYNTPANYFENENLADALAQMAIWLIENGYVK